MALEIIKKMKFTQHDIHLIFEHFFTSDDKLKFE